MLADLQFPSILVTEIVHFKNFNVIPKLSTFEHVNLIFCCPAEAASLWWHRKRWSRRRKPLHKRQVDQRQPLVSEMLAVSSEGAIVIASGVVDTRPPL